MKEARREDMVVAPTVSALAVRFVAGGLVVALVPQVARWLGPQVAGIAVLVPVVSITGFYAVGRAAGRAAVASAALGSLASLPAVGAFLLATYAASRLGWSVPAALAAGLAGWLVIALPLAVLSRSA